MLTCIDIILTCCCAACVAADVLACADIDCVDVADIDCVVVDCADVLMVSYALSARTRAHNTPDKRKSCYNVVIYCALYKSPEKVCLPEKV